MMYKYEESLKNRLLNLELDDYVEVIQLEKEYEELKEVYAKAKAFDQIKVIHDKHINDFLNMSETECIEKIGDILEDK